MCCPASSSNCKRKYFQHSLVQFDDKQKIVVVPIKGNASTSCTLTALGLVVGAGTWACLQVLATESRFRTYRELTKTRVLVVEGEPGKPELL